MVSINWLNAVIANPKIAPGWTKAESSNLLRALKRRDYRRSPKLKPEPLIFTDGILSLLGQIRHQLRLDRL